MQLVQARNYPYMLVNPEDMELEDGKTYQVAISGISEKTGIRNGSDRQWCCGYGCGQRMFLGNLKL